MVYPYHPCHQLLLHLVHQHRVVSPDISPLGLNQLSKEILEKKSKMVKGMEMMNGESVDMSMAIMLGEGKEVMVQLRLFYLGVVRRMEV